MPFLVYSQWYGPRSSSFKSNRFCAVPTAVSLVISSWRTLYVRSSSCSGSIKPGAFSNKISASLAFEMAFWYFSSCFFMLVRSFLSRTPRTSTPLPRP